MGFWTYCEGPPPPEDPFMNTGAQLVGKLADHSSQLNFSVRLALSLQALSQTKSHASPSQGQSTSNDWPVGAMHKPDLLATVQGDSKWPFWLQSPHWVSRDLGGHCIRARLLPLPRPAPRRSVMYLVSQSTGDIFRKVTSSSTLFQTRGKVYVSSPWSGAVLWLLWPQCRGHWHDGPKF